jgi:hypothetical protein
VVSSGKATMSFVLTAVQLRDMAIMRTSAQVARWQGHLCSTLPSSFRPKLPPTPAVLSLFCQLSHGILLPKVAATTGLKQCPRPAPSKAPRCRTRSWQAATRRPAPGLAPGCMRAAGTTCIIITRRRRRTCTWSTQLALSTMATSPASSSSRCREAGRRTRRKSIMAAPAAASATPAMQ